MKSLLDECVTSDSRLDVAQVVNLCSCFVHKQARNAPVCKVDPAYNDFSLSPATFFGQL